ncbi:MAG: hypothetical protein K6E22_11110 [Treponema sp.]|nr:hypothetical protein [Treponema sp.]
MKKEYVKRDDYELYSFPMPFLLKRSRRKNYIEKKLEQLHPCFSDNCCYDAKYRLKKGKLMAAVAVMDKVKLAEYKSGDKKHTPLKFGDENKLKFFNSDKILNIFLAVIVSLLAGIFFVSHTIHSKEKLQAARNKENKSPSSAMTAEGNADDSKLQIHQNILLAYNTLDNFLQRTRTESGKIKSCSLIFLEDKNTEEAYKMNFCMSECFPQAFFDNEENKDGGQKIFSPVTYFASKPEFSASLYSKSQNVIRLKQKLSKNQIDDIRLSIWSCNGVLLTDFSDEGTVEFLFPNSSAEKLLEGLKLACDEHSIFPAAIEIEGGKVNSRMKIIFAEKIDEKDHNPLTLINRNSNVFLPKNSPRETASKVPVLTKKSYGRENSEKREDFGRIIQKDGSVLVFYKNKNGKITGERK